MTPPATGAAWTTLAHLLRPQGRRGELLAELLTDFPERFTGGLRVLLARPGFQGAAEQAQAVEVTASWLPLGKNAGRVVLAFAGIDSIAAAEPLAGLDVLIPDSELMPLEDDAAYIADLLGCIVYDGATAVGTIIDVDFPTTPDGARRLPDVAPLLTVESPAGQEILIPYVKAFLVELDLPGRRIEMNLPEGLVELNQAASPAHDAGADEDADA